MEWKFPITQQSKSVKLCFFFSSLETDCSGFRVSECESEVERRDGKRWEAAGTTVTVPSPLRGLAEHPSARLPGHEFSPPVPQPERRGRESARKVTQPLANEVFPEDDSFHRTALCWVRILFFFFEEVFRAELLTC